MQKLMNKVQDEARAVKQLMHGELPKLEKQLRNCHEITCAFCLSAFPIAASESLVDARIDYVFILALEKASCVNCTRYF